MKIPLFTKLTAKSRGRKVVRASAARAARGHDDYYEEEPNMKLSHAFMVVLILHVVAVGGIYAFNHINARKSTSLLGNISERFTQATGAASAVAAAAPAAEPTTAPAAAATAAPEAAAPVVAASSASAAPKAPAAAAPAAPAATAPSTAAAASAEVPEVYTVERGDNPYNIAKRFGVSYTDLLTLNGIEDPTKLQIGQKLKMPRPGQ
jgi:nucleoid-associated protein YgaU